MAFIGRVFVDSEGWPFIPLKGGNWLRPINQCSKSDRMYIEAHEGVDVPIHGSDTLYKIKGQAVTIDPAIQHALLGRVYKLKGSAKQIAEYWTCWDAKGKRVLEGKAMTTKHNAETVDTPIDLGCFQCGNRDATKLELQHPAPQAKWAWIHCAECGCEYRVGDWEGSPETADPSPQPEDTQNFQAAKTPNWKQCKCKECGQEFESPEEQELCDECDKTHEARKPSYAPDVKHVKETKVLLPDVLIKGTYHDLVADISLDPISQGYDAVVEVMGYKVKAWGLKIKEAKEELAIKVNSLITEMGWDKVPVRAFYERNPTENSLDPMAADSMPALESNVRGNILELGLYIRDRLNPQVPIQKEFFSQLSQRLQSYLEAKQAKSINNDVLSKLAATVESIWGLTQDIEVQQACQYMLSYLDSAKFEKAQLAKVATTFTFEVDPGPILEKEISDYLINSGQAATADLEALKDQPNMLVLSIADPSGYTKGVPYELKEGDSLAYGPYEVREALKDKKVVLK